MSRAALLKKVERLTGRAARASAHRTVDLRIISVRSRPLSAKQRQLLIQLIARSPEKSDRQLAQESGVSARAVARARAKAGIANKLSRRRPELIEKQLIDLHGQLFGAWLAVAYAGNAMWECVCTACDARARRNVNGSNLRSGKTTSCGCVRKPRIDSKGKQFGRWMVIAYAGNGWWLCRCMCKRGTLRTVRGSVLRSGRSRSCGCLTRERCTTHGQSHTAQYKAWQTTLQRCRNPRNRDYENYGGRGIDVYSGWPTYAEHFADVGERPEGLSLDRVENDQGYMPWNLGWATREQQTRNRRPPRRRKRAAAKQLELPVAEIPF